MSPVCDWTVGVAVQVEDKFKRLHHCSYISLLNLQHILRKVRSLASDGDFVSILMSVYNCNCEHV